MQRTNVGTPRGESSGWVGGGGGGMNWEIGIDMYTPIRIKQITNKNPLHKKINKIQKKKNSSSFQKAKLEFAGNYLHSVYIAFTNLYAEFTLGIISNLEMI